MRYSIFVKVQGTEHFLQSSDSLERIRQPKATVDRWITEMGVAITNHASVEFIITDNGVPILSKTLIGNGSRSWLAIAKP